jgi:hypothetical protein
MSKDGSERCRSSPTARYDGSTGEKDSEVMARECLTCRVGMEVDVDATGRDSVEGERLRRCVFPDERPHAMR